MSLIDTDIPPQGLRLPGAERYVLRRLLGRGGFGDAYLADDEALARRVVIKLLMNLQDPSIRDRFTREARISANIHHPAVVQVHDIGALPDGRPYFVMEWVDGMPLSQFIKERAATLALSHALTIIAEAAEGLAVAHAMNVIHRDIKPDNILVTRSGGHAKLIDFGIAKKAMEDSGGAATVRQTQLGTVLGTPRYISPEQAMAKVLAAASDLYSLGCVLYAVLTGRSPFEGSQQELMMHHVYTPAPTLASAVPGRTFPRDVEGIVARLLAKDPLRRYQRGDELARALRRCIDQAKAEEESEKTAAVAPIADPTMQDSLPAPTVDGRRSLPQAAPAGWDEAGTVSQARGQQHEVAPAGWNESEGSGTAAFVGLDGGARASHPVVSPGAATGPSQQVTAMVLPDDRPAGRAPTPRPKRGVWIALGVIAVAMGLAAGATRLLTRGTSATATSRNPATPQRFTTEQSTATPTPVVTGKPTDSTAQVESSAAKSASPFASAESSATALPPAKSVSAATTVSAKTVSKPQPAPLGGPVKPTSTGKPAANPADDQY